MTTESPMTDMEARIVRRVRQQFRCDAIEFAGWQPSGVATYRVPDPVTAARMRDRGFHVVDANGRVSASVIVAESLDTPAPDRGAEMFERFCVVAIVLAAIAVAAWVVFSTGGGQ